MDAWVKSGMEGSADRVQAIHVQMDRLFRETGDAEMAPTLVSYNTLLSAWTKTPDCMDRAEEVMQEMMVAWQRNNTELKPDATTFVHLINGYSHQERPNLERAQQLLLVMDDMAVSKTFYVYGALQNAYARSRRKDAPEKANELLEEMLEESKKDEKNLLVKPTVVNFNTVLNACSRSPSLKSALLAKNLLHQMRKSVEEGGHDIEPDRISYLMTLYACASCPDESIGAPMAQEILDQMEAQAIRESQQQQESHCMAPLRVTLGTEGYNAVLSAWARSALPQSVEQSLNIVHRMEMLANQGSFHDVWPNRRSYNAVLNSMVRTTDAPEALQMAEKATQILRAMWKIDSEGKAFCKPDSYSYTAILILYQKSLSPNAANKVDGLIREMEQLYEDDMLENAADVVHYTIAISTWARSRVRGTVHRCSQILLHMMERHKAGHSNCIPNNRTYNAFIDALSRAREEERAEKVLYYMLDQYRRGNVDMAPDSFSFNSVLIAFCKARRKGCGQQAENILERLLQYCEEENPQVVPNERSFAILINYYCRSKMPDAPYRAEFLLNRMIDLCRARGSCIPGLSSKCFVTVIEFYATKRLQDGGERAERLLRVMKELRRLDGSSNLRIDATVLASVMLAWAHSGDDHAGQKAEYHLDTMERRFADGMEAMRPTTRCYGIALSAWTRSSVEGKACRALSVLRRMEEQIRLGNRAVSPNSFAKSLVINACSFSNRSPKEEADAYSIAVTVFEEIVNSTEVDQPLSVSYGWFLQLCGRLSLGEDEKLERIEQAFQKCCEQGLVNDLVLSRLKGAAPPELYTELLQPVRDRLAGAELPHVVRMTHLPTEWKLNASRKREDERIWWTRAHK